MPLNKQKTKEFLSYMSLHKNIRDIQFTLNFFIEYHGKADCDGHFGLVKTKVYLISIQFKFNVILDKRMAYWSPK